MSVAGRLLSIRTARHGPRPAKHIHSGCPGIQKHADAGRGGRAGRPDVIDEDHMAPPHLLRSAARKSERAPYRALTGGPPQRMKRRSPLHAAHSIQFDLKSGSPGQRAGDESGLVEPARPDPPAMQRHRDKQRIGRPFRQKARKMPGHDPGVTCATRIFETVDQRAGNALETGRRTNPRERRRIGKARPTFRPFFGKLWQIDTASRADGRCDEWQAGPAVHTETAILHDDLAAAGAARGQGIVENGSECAPEVG